jgi:hypothetical protein
LKHTMQKIKVYKCEGSDHFFTEHVVTSVDKNNHWLDKYYPGKTELGFADIDHLVCSVDIEVGDTALVCHAGSSVWFVAVVPPLEWWTPAAKAAAIAEAASFNGEWTPPTEAMLEESEKSLAAAIAEAKAAVDPVADAVENETCRSCGCAIPPDDGYCDDCQEIRDEIAFEEGLLDD